MRLLLDTNALLGIFTGIAKIGPRATEELALADEIAVSVVAFVEIGIKTASGKLTVRQDLEAMVKEDGLAILGLTPRHGAALATLPLHHLDPFDRLLVVQALHGGWTIVTTDRTVAVYGVPVLDPRR